jgi:hypothetical protein
MRMNPAHCRCTVNISDRMSSDLILRHSAREGVMARRDSLSRGARRSVEFVQFRAVFEKRIPACGCWRRRAAPRIPYPTHHQDLGPGRKPICPSAARPVPRRSPPRIAGYWNHSLSAVGGRSRDDDRKLCAESLTRSRCLRIACA